MAASKPIIELLTAALGDFWDRVPRGISADKCWPWQGHIAVHGYGMFSTANTRIRAHRMAFLVANGSMPEVVMHVCDNTACVNPSHLKAGDVFANTRDALEKGRLHFQKLTHCKHGHEYTPENTRVRQTTRRDGSHGISRSCLTCQRLHNRDYMRRKASESGRGPHVSKLTEKAVVASRIAYAEGLVSVSDLMRRYDMSDLAIRLMLDRKTWKDVA